MEQPFKIIIDGSGNISTVYSEAIDLLSLGKPTIHRATEVKYNNENSRWEIFSKKPVFQNEELIATGFLSRTEAIFWEVNFLNTNMEKIVNAQPER